LISSSIFDSLRNSSEALAILSPTLLTIWTFMGSFESFDFFKTSEYCWKLKERNCESGIKRRLFLSVSGTVAQAKRKKRVRSVYSCGQSDSFSF
jgi:hypothetical protein